MSQLSYLNPLPVLTTPDVLYMTRKFIVHPNDAVEFRTCFACSELPNMLVDVIFSAEAPKGHPILIDQQSLTRFTLPSVSWIKAMQSQKDLAE